ncbi:accessory Sec system protein Asp1 [Leuconostoc litchii]|uniref:Accessory Sec system protein Asp1 n=2 Tax=Leuconostoc litchii TaxID=1981069 RepID=A0A652NDS4_9LACO|nr:accessory Sec system protein Asp1 [Leuconostoc litchii]
MPDWSTDGEEIPQFNDSIHQAQLFLEEEQEVTFVLCNYEPRLRSILSCKNIDRVTVWSAFDILQHVNLTAQRTLSLTDFSWPKYAEFITMPERILVQVAGKHYATVWFSQLYFDKIDLFDEKDNVIQQLLIDDRGFVSQIGVFDDSGHKIRTDYLTPGGDIAMQENHSTGQVVTQQSWTELTKFDSMTALVAMALDNYLHQVPDDENLIVSPSATNNKILLSINIKQPMIFSIQNNTKKEIADFVMKTDFIVTDSQVHSHQFKDLLDEKVPIVEISPYAIQLNKKHNIKRPLKNIFVTMQGINNELQNLIIETLVNVVNKYDDVTVVLENPGDISAIKEQLEAASLFARNEHGLIDRDSQIAFKSRFNLLGIQNEEQRLKYVKKAHILIDLEDVPDHFLQISAVNFLVPQINVQKSSYVIPDKNGKILTDISELESAIQFYLSDADNEDSMDEVAEALQSENNSEMLWIKWQQIFNKIKSKRTI